LFTRHIRMQFFYTFWNIHIFILIFTPGYFKQNKNYHK
jgi:hypothetical protein